MRSEVGEGEKRRVVGGFNATTHGHEGDSQRAEWEVEFRTFQKKAS